MDYRGLAIESAKSFTDINSFNVRSRKVGGVEITDVRIVTPQKGFKRGRYITLTGAPYAKEMSELLRRALLQMLPNKGRLLAVGLGNPDITYDRLGAEVIRSVTAREGKCYSLCAVEADVAVRTGVDTAQLVCAVAREIHADCVIAVDSLSCGQPSGLGGTVQLTDAGLIAGSGTGKSDSTPLARDTLGVPIVAVGVPLVTVLSQITHSKGDNAYHVSRCDADTLVKIWAEAIGGALDDIVG